MEVFAVHGRLLDKRKDGDDDDGSKSESPTSVNDSNNGNEIPIIAGASAAGICLLVLLLFFIIRRVRRYRRKESSGLLVSKNSPGSSSADIENKMPSVLGSVEMGSPLAAIPIPRSVANVVITSNNVAGLSNSDRNQLRNTFLTYHTSASSSKLSSVLRESFSGKQSNASRVGSNGTMSGSVGVLVANDVLGERLPSKNEIISFKSNISKEDQKLFERLKTVSTKFSNDLGRVSALLTIKSGNTAKSTPNLSKASSFALTSDVAKKIIQRVCKKIDDETLSAEEVAVVQSAINSRTPRVNNPNQAIDLDREFRGGAPSIGIEPYLQRLVLGLNAWFGEEGDENRADSQSAGIRSLLMALLYFERIKGLEPNFTLTVFNVHRLFAVMMLIAAKFCEDEYISAEYWGKVVGVDDKELGHLEEQLCFSSGFNFAVAPIDILKLYKTYGVEEFNVQDWEAEVRTTMGSQATFFTALTESNPMMKTKVKKRKRLRKQGEFDQEEDPM